MAMHEENFSAYGVFDGKKCFVWVFLLGLRNEPFCWPSDQERRRDAYDSSESVTLTCANATDVTGFHAVASTW
jgi:hypothetical protein